MLVAPTSRPLPIRADVFHARVERLRQWLAARPERSLALVSHWGTLQARRGFPDEPQALALACAQVLRLPCLRLLPLCASSAAGADGARLRQLRGADPGPEPAQGAAAPAGAGDTRAGAAVNAAAQRHGGGRCGRSSQRQHVKSGGAGMMHCCLLWPTPNRPHPACSILALAVPQPVCSRSASVRPCSNVAVPAALPALPALLACWRALQVGRLF